MIVNLSLNETLPTFLLYVRQTKDSTTHMHGLAVYVKEAIPFAWDISLEILTYVFDRLYFTQFLTSFSSIDHLFRLYASFLILFHLT